MSNDISDVCGGAQPRTEQGEFIRTVSAGSRDEDAFLNAWKRGVVLAGARFFGDGSGIGATKYDFAPQVDLIEHQLGMLSSTEATFLATMVTFYNCRVGGQMMAQLNYGTWGMADVAGALDPVRRRIIADLLLSYPGW
jgi:hypothetical protein